MEFATELLVPADQLLARSIGLHGWDELAMLTDVTTWQANPVCADARILATHLAQRLVETLTRRRDPKQLGRWLSFSECEALSAWIRAHREEPIRIARINLAETWPGHIEGRIQIAYPTRVLSAGLYLETRSGRWTCPGLKILLPGCSWSP